MSSMNAKKRTLLITLTGRDRPGVTSRLFTTLSAFPVSVADVEQVVTSESSAWLSAHPDIEIATIENSPS